MSQDAPRRPARSRGILEDEFWSHVSQRRLSLQICKSCSHIWYPPGPVCPQCLSEDWGFQAVSGHGRIHSWTVFHRQYFPELPSPYTIVSIELAEGPLMIGDIRMTKNEQLQVGMQVRVTYEAVSSEGEANWILFHWEPA
jgi:uncharacterized OB-fold protein